MEANEHCYILQIYSVVVILYRVATFNDCNEAADELKKVK